MPGLRDMIIRGPSPVVPSLMVGFLWLILCGPSSLLSLLERLVLLIQGVLFFLMAFLMLLLLLSVFFPGRRLHFEYSSSFSS